MRRYLVRLGVAALASLAAYHAKLSFEIYRTAAIDEAREADVIVIMGAAEYRGRPSPVLKARLDHGLDLWRRKLAPRILTTGGRGGDPVFTEGEVGRNYLMSRNVPPEAIIVEPDAESTAHSIAATAEIMRRMNLHSCLMVTDGYHVYRAKRMLQEHGVAVYASPRPARPGDAWKLWLLCGRQAVGYMLWSLGIVI